jgi:hypothetical protein
MVSYYSVLIIGDLWRFSINDYGTAVMIPRRAMFPVAAARWYGPCHAMHAMQKEGMRSARLVVVDQNRQPLHCGA